MNKMNQFMSLEIYVGEWEKHVCHLLSDKLGLGGRGLKGVGK